MFMYGVKTETLNKIPSLMKEGSEGVEAPNPEYGIAKVTIDKNSNEKARLVATNDRFEVSNSIHHMDTTMKPIRLASGQSEGLVATPPSQMKYMQPKGLQIMQMITSGANAPNATDEN